MAARRAGGDFIECGLPPRLEKCFGASADISQHEAKMLIENKANAVLAASLFHFGTHAVGNVKQFLAKQNIPVRL